MQLGYSIKVFSLTLRNEPGFYDILHSDYHKNPQKLVKKLYSKLKRTKFFKNVKEKMQKVGSWNTRKEERIEILGIPSSWLEEEGFEVLSSVFRFLFGKPLFVWFPSRTYCFSRIESGISIGHDELLWITRPDKLSFVLELSLKIVKGHGENRQNWGEIKKQIEQEDLFQVLHLLKIDSKEYDDFLKVYEEIADALSKGMDCFYLFSNNKKGGRGHDKRKNTINH